MKSSPQRDPVGDQPVDITVFERLAELADEFSDYLDDLPHDVDAIPKALVGGAPRSKVMGEAVVDFDVVTSVNSPQPLLQRGFQQIGASSFDVLHDANREEWALTRTETKPEDNYGYKGIQTDTTEVSLLEDLRRRDFRMNAMAIVFDKEMLPDGGTDTPSVIALDEASTEAYFFDPFGGIFDLQNGVIRHISAAFSDDPLRILRGARYAARYLQPGVTLGEADDPLGEGSSDPAFMIAPETKDLMRQVAPELNRMSRERIGEEVEKAMLQAERPAVFWETLEDVGALAVTAPALDRARIVPAGPDDFHREGDTFEHTMMVLRRMDRLCDEQGITGIARVRRLLMAVGHDLGKVEIANRKGGLWSDSPPRRFGGHAEAGVGVVDQLTDSLGLDAHYAAAMEDAARLHMDFHDLPTYSERELINFVDDHNLPAEANTPYTARIEELLDLAHADHEGRFQSLDASLGERTSTTLIADEKAPEHSGRPKFNRERFEALIDRAKLTVAKVDGHTAMREGLCEEHKTQPIQKKDLGRVLSECSDCQTPSSWVGERITDLRIEAFNKCVTPE